MLWGLFVVVVKFATLGFAGLDSTRARFWQGLVAIGLMLYVVVAFALGLMDSSLVLPLGDQLRQRWWLTFVLLPPFSFAAMALALRARRTLATDDPRYEPLDRAALGFLANGLFDTAILILGLALEYLMSRSDF